MLSVLKYMKQRKYYLLLHQKGVNIHKIFGITVFSPGGHGDQVALTKRFLTVEYFSEN